MPKQFTAVGMEIYAGLNTIGVQEAGFKVLGHLESSSYAVKTARLNFPDIDIRTNNEWGDLTKFFMVDYIMSNAPCAPWSSASRSFTHKHEITGRIGRDAWRDDPRLDIHRNIGNVARSLQPKSFVTESITNAWINGREFWLEQAHEWAALGYSISVLLQNNKWINGIQRRPRMFFIAHKHELEWPEFTHPETTHNLIKHIKVSEKEKTDAKLWLSPWLRKLWELSPQVSGSLARVVRDGLIVKPQGESTPSFLVRRAKADEIPNVMLSGKTRYHYAEPRQYSWLEWKALCGMPDWWESAQPLEEATKELARAVMPGAAKWIATAVINGLRKKPMKTAEYRVYNFLDAFHPYDEPLQLEAA